MRKPSRQLRLRQQGSLLAVSIFALVCSRTIPLAASGAVPLEVPPDIAFPADFDRQNLEDLLHPGHPRLLATEADWTRLRRNIEADPHLKAVVRALQEGADEMLESPLVERELIGRRMLAASREVLKRVLTLASLYRLTGEERYLQYCREQLLHAAAFSDWNPSHFLDTAEMTLAVAVGYDWLHDQLSEADRSTLRLAIVEKGLEPGRGPQRFKVGNNNWNQVCFAGMVAGALAVAEHEPDLALEFLREAMANNHRALDEYRPHGAYPEGPSYWNYGTHFQLILVSVLQSALGTAWNLENYPAFQDSGIYINVMIGPTGLFYNYADGGPRLGLLPAVHWFAAQAANPALDARQRQRLLEGAAAGSVFRGRGGGNRLFPLMLFWLDPQIAGRGVQAELPLHWRSDGPNPVAVHRASWNEDALFVGIKGGSPAVNHGHMDIGSFVLDFKGVRWAIDLGLQSYESIERLGMSLWARGQDSDRWRIFRLNTFSHNTLVIDDSNQRVDGFAPIIAFSDDPAGPFTVVDMTDVYRGSITRALRGARMIADDAILIHDHLLGPDEGQSVRWGMVTAAEVELQGDRATLRQDGKTLHARILSPAEAVFEIVPTDPPPNEWDAPNPGTRMLAFTHRLSDAATHLRVVLSGESLSDKRVEELRGAAPPAEW